MNFGPVIRAASAALLLTCLSGLAGCGDDGAAGPTDAGFDAGPPVDAGFDAGPVPSTLFGPCYTDEQCPGGDGICRTSLEGWPEGYCTRPCEDRGPCDDGDRYNHCLASEAGDMYCEAKCLNGIDCGREGYTCVGQYDAMGNGICIGLCDEDADCGGGAVCNEWAATCVPPEEDRTVGSGHGGACADDADCLSDNCIQAYAPRFSGWNGGYCIGFCILPMGYNTNTFFAGDALPQGSCQGDAVCFPNGSYTRGDLGVCLQQCTADADCRADEAYYCLKDIDLASGDVSSYANGVCLPMSCRFDPCPSGFECRTLATSSGNIYRCEKL